MVQVTKVGKAFKGFHLENIEFALPAGYIMGLVGENGAGKTTLLKILSGLYRADTGSVRLFADTYEEAEQAIKDRIGTVFHEEFFSPYETLVGNANRWGCYYSHYDSQLFLKTAEHFGLDISKKVKQLSKGEKLKFSLAFALSHQPGLLLLDEPSASFDEDFQKEFKRILQEFVADGEHSVILSTHQTEELAGIADYLLMLKDGKQLLFGDMETIRDRYDMVSGEAYKLRLIRKEWIIYKEEREFGCQALVNSLARPFDPLLKVRKPTIAEIMYAYSKRKKEGAPQWKM